MRIPFLTVVLVLSLWSPHLVHAQRALNWVGYDDETCQYSVENVRTAVPFPERTQALWYLRVCGEEGAVTLAQELTRLRATSDAPMLESTFFPIASLVHPEILDAALDLAADRSATVGSRVVAFRLLSSYEDGGNVFPSLSSFLSGNPVQLAAGGQSARMTGAALPSDWKDVTRDLLNRIAGDGAENETIRNAARWTLGYFGS